MGVYMNFYIIALLFFSYFNTQASGALPGQKVQDLKSVVSRTSNYVEHSQLPLSSDDYIHQALQISTALSSAGCEENCLSGYVHAATTCAASCIPLYAARVRYSYTLYTAQQYIISFHATHQDSTRYIQLRGNDNDDEKF